MPSLVGRDAPKYTIGERIAGTVGDEVPGPGTYDASYTLAHARSPLAKMNPYHEHHEANLNPGPGTYNPEYNLTQQ